MPPIPDRSPIRIAPSARLGMNSSSSCPGIADLGCKRDGFAQVGHLAHGGQRRDIGRFAHFAQGYLYIHPDNPNLLADLRYGTLPHDDRSFWGIEINRDTPNRHVVLKRLRKLDQRHYDTFWLMLNGRFERVE